MLNRVVVTLNVDFSHEYMTLLGVKAEIEDGNKEMDVQGVNMASITDAMDGLLDKSSGESFRLLRMIGLACVCLSDSFPYILLVYRATHGSARYELQS